MIARLKGRVAEIGEDHLVLDVGGVGYLVFAPARVLARLAPGEEVVLAIETHVREDHIHLYGFADAADRAMFRLLCGVSGVGARLALALLSVLDAEALSLAIAAHDRTALARAPGVGKRLAERICHELKDKVGSLPGSGSGPAAAEQPGIQGAGATGGLVEDAVSALVHLGYGRMEALGAVRASLARQDEAPDLAALIRDSLKELAG